MPQQDCEEKINSRYICMQERILKYIPSPVKSNTICRSVYLSLYNAAYRAQHKIGDNLFYLNYGRKLRKFKDVHKGERCFIIGNGPSILHQDLTKLNAEVVFVTNNFVRHQQYEEINPTYYCVNIDLLGDEFDAEWYSIMLEKTRNTVKFFSNRVKPFVKKNHLFLNHPFFYLNCTGTPIWETKSMSLDVTKKVDYGSTLIIDFCLPLAFYMGFSEVYLLGCDCDYKLDKAEDLSKGYFYHVSRPFDRQSLEEHGNPWYEKVTMSYVVAKEMFEQFGRKIYNAGAGGKLEVFKRVNYDSLF